MPQLKTGFQAVVYNKLGIPDIFYPVRETYGQALIDTKSHASEGFVTEVQEVWCEL